MKSPKSIDFSNPLSDLIDDEIFNMLKERDLFNKKTLRDHLMRRKFQYLRENKVPANEAIDMLRQEYPYLQPDTIRKIVYNI
ncbi:MAG: hypothetical protein D6830_00065 [Ignavibacteria bacterium]|nr:MAG: hypothetical protein D6830_00065 [Ignavibacteria bacterium]